MLTILFGVVEMTEKILNKNSDGAIHSAWLDQTYDDIIRKETLEKNARPLNTTGGTFGKSVTVHNVYWDERELVSLVVMTGLNRRVQCGFTYKEALELASRLISAAKIAQEKIKEAGRV